MISQNYTAEESREVRDVYFNACRRSKVPDKRKMIITREEWHKYSKMGVDMSRYEALQDFQSRMRKQESKRFKQQAMEATYAQ